MRIVLVHHNLHHRMGVAEYVASLYDRKAFSAAMHRIGASMVLHGHTHHPHQGHLPARRGLREDAIELDNLGGDIPVLGCGSSTWTPRGARTADLAQPSAARTSSGSS